MSFRTLHFMYGERAATFQKLPMNSIKNNLMALHAANTLTSQYGRLSTSAQRLSYGLRVNSAADDAAGLAIRELMRADVATLNQGQRNANDPYQCCKWLMALSA